MFINIQKHFSSIYRCFGERIGYEDQKRDQNQKSDQNEAVQSGTGGSF